MLNSELRQERAAGSLVDILLFTSNLSVASAESDSSDEDSVSSTDDGDLSILGSFLPLLELANRPLIWYVLTPLLNHGFLHFFICLREEEQAVLKEYLLREFPTVTFHFITCKSNYGGIKGYLQRKRELRSASEEELLTTVVAPPATRDVLREERLRMAGLRRDCLLVSCDTVLAGVDVGEQVNHFYHSLASVSALFFRPLDPSMIERKSEGEAKNKGPPPFTPSPYHHQFCCVAYDEEDVVSAMATGAEQLSSLKYSHPEAEGGAHRYNGLLHRRLYYLSPFEDTEVTVTMAFAARRPNLTFAADVCDAGIYAVRSWVLEYIDKSDDFDADSTLQELALTATLLRSQHTTVNSAEGVCNTPDRKIDFPIPLHWMYDHQDGSIDALNAASGIHLPARADSLRVFATFLEEQKDVPRRVYRVNSLANYKSISQELLHRKCYRLGLLEGQPSAAAPAVGDRRLNPPPGVRQCALDQIPSTGPPLCSFALTLLPLDSPVTMKEKVGSVKMYISGCVLATVPPPDCYLNNSIIGEGVRLGHKARVKNSILLRGAEVGDGAQVIDSVIGVDTEVAAGVTVQNSTIGSWLRVEENTANTVVSSNE